MSDPLAKARADITKRRRNREIEARQLSRLIKQRQAEAGTNVPILTFYGLNHKAVAVVQIFGDRARVSRFTDIGPMGHSETRVNKLADELRDEGYRPIEDPNAGAVLDMWASRQKWVDGLRSMQIVNLNNALCFHGYFEQAREVWTTENVALGYLYCKQFGINVY